MTTHESLGIGDVARRAGLRPSAIRYYESAGLLPEPARAGGRRRYGRDVFTDLAIIALARQAGFSLKEIRRLRRGAARARPAKRWTELAREKLPQVEALIARAQEMKDLLLRGMECRCARVEECPGVQRRVRSMTERPR